MKATNHFELVSDPRVQEVFDLYPDAVRPKMMELRQLVLDTAAQLSNIKKLEETLKWGEPSFLTKHGSTVRMDWKVKTPDQVAVYFKCTSKLVPTFRKVFGDLFKYQDNRAIEFDLSDEIPKEALQRCIAAALQYHKVKHLPDLDI